MFERIFGWYLKGSEMADFIGRCHSGMACLLAPFCDPSEVEDYIQRARFRDEATLWLHAALLALAPAVCMLVGGFCWLHLAGWGGFPLSGWDLLAELALLTLWTLYGQPFIGLQIRLWRAASMGADSARLVRHVQQYRVAQAAEQVQQFLYERTYQ